MFDSTYMYNITVKSLQEHILSVLPSLTTCIDSKEGTISNNSLRILLVEEILENSCYERKKINVL